MDKMFSKNVPVRCCVAGVILSIPSQYDSTFTSSFDVVLANGRLLLDKGLLQLFPAHTVLHLHLTTLCDSLNVVSPSCRRYASTAVDLVGSPILGSSTSVGFTTYVPTHRQLSFAIMWLTYFGDTLVCLRLRVSLKY